MQRSTRQNKEKPLMAQDARDLILQLIDPGNEQSLAHYGQEERLQILLYIMKTVGFKASGLRCTAQTEKMAWGGDLKDTAVYAIAIREGDVSEMFSLHKKIKVSIVQEEDVDEQVIQATQFLSKMSAGRVFDTVSWEESYPEPMKPKDLLAEIKCRTPGHINIINNLNMITQAWKLRQDTLPVQMSRVQPRL